VFGKLSDALPRALRAKKKQGWASAALGGIPQLLRDWAASASVALAEPSFCSANHRFSYPTRPKAGSLNLDKFSGRYGAEQLS
jgi:hypothetical protein